MSFERDTRKCFLTDFYITLDHWVCSIYFSYQAVKCLSAKAFNGIIKAHNTFEKYLFKILDTLFIIPMVMQIRHALRFLALNIMQRFKVWLFASYASTSKFTQLYPISSCQQLFVELILYATY